MNSYEVKIQINKYTAKGRTRPILTVNVEARNETSAYDRAVNEICAQGHDSSTYNLISVREV